MRAQNGKQQGLGETGSTEKSTQISEVIEMTNQEQNIQTELISMKIDTEQNSGIKSENERGNEMLMAQNQNWFSRSLSNVVSLKLLAGLAVGAMLMTTIGLNSVRADEPSRPLGSVYYMAPDLSVDHKLSSNNEFWGHGFAGDIPTISAKAKFWGYGFAEDVAVTNAKAKFWGYGFAEDVASTATVLNHGTGAMTDVPTMAKIDARTLGNVSNSTITSKLDPGIYGFAEDIPTINAKAKFSGYGFAEDVPATATIHVLPTGAMTDIIS